METKQPIVVESDRSRAEQFVRIAGWSALVIYVGMWVWWLVIPSGIFDPINARASERIEAGMSDKNVVDILGRKADSDFTYKGVNGPITEKYWRGSYWTIVVRFDALGNVKNHYIVKSAGFTPNRPLGS